MNVMLRYPNGRWCAPRLTVGEFRLLRTLNGRWRITRTRKGAMWSLATRPTLAGTLIAAWKRRAYYPHALYR